MAPPTITKGMTLGLALVGMFLCELKTAVAQTVVLYMFIKVHLRYLCLHQHVYQHWIKVSFYQVYYQRKRKPYH